MKLYQYIDAILFLSIVVISCNSKQEQTYITVRLENSDYTIPIREHYLKCLDSAVFYIKKIDTLSSLQENQSFFLKSRKW